MSNSPEKLNPEREAPIEEEEVFKTREEEVKEKGPIFYEEREGKHFVNICGIDVETFASKEDIEKVKENYKKEVVEFREFLEIMRDIAIHYRQKELFHIEGPTAVSKTFSVNTFNKLLYGPEEEPLDFYCKGQTDETQLMAKWVPRSEDPEDQKKWNKFLESEAGSKNLTNIYKEAQKKEFSEEERRNYIIAKMKELAKNIGVGEKAEFKLQYGLFPRGMTAKGGKGCIIHMQEPAIAEPQIIDTMLALRGEKGKIARSIQLWEDGGRTIKAGENFWVVLSDNPPEQYPARNELDPALARATVWKRVGELSGNSISQIGDFAFTYGKEKPELTKEEKEEIYIIPTEAPIDLRKHPEIGKILAEPIIEFHSSFAKSLKEGLEKERRQKIPLTCDEFFKIAGFLQELQTKDLYSDLKKAVEIYYSERLGSEEVKEDVKGLFETALSKMNTKEKLQRAIEEIDPEVKKQREEEVVARHIKEMLDHPEIPSEVKKLLKKAKSADNFREAFPIFREALELAKAKKVKKK